MCIVMSCPIASLTVRVPERLREDMRKLTGVNWSAVVRDAIEQRVRIEELDFCEVATALRYHAMDG